MCEKDYFDDFVKEKTSLKTLLNQSTFSLFRNKSLKTKHGRFYKKKIF